MKAMKERFLSTLKRMGPRLGWVFLGAFLALAAAIVFRDAPDPTPHVHSAEETSQTVWTCSMHPQIRASEPGQCPICGMDLIEVAGEGQSALPDDQIRLSPRAQALARLRTTVVRRRTEYSGNVRLLGRIELNETTLKTVTAWSGGRIDRLFVRSTGEKVHGGQAIASLYSPEVYSAHQDLIVAQRQVERLREASPATQKAAEAALGAARERLRLLGVPDAELARLESQSQPTRSVTVRTPFPGTVLERLVSEGAYVTTGQPLFKIADLSQLWIELDAYEGDLSLLSLKQKVRVEVEAFPGEIFEGTITFIQPMLDPSRRTARVRVAVDNPEGRLRPGMFAAAVVATEATANDDEATPLVIPKSAPLFTGRRAIVYVEVPNAERPTYEARTVRLGPLLSGVYPVVAGLSEGERIVVRGAFALDADLQIRGGDSMMTSADDREPGPWDDALAIPRTELRKIAPVFGAYLTVQRALADDDLARSQAGAQEVSQAISAVELTSESMAGPVWDPFSTLMAEGAREIAEANSLETARRGFERMSGAAVMLLRTLGNPLDKTLVQAHCPMAVGSRGASWVQEGRTIDNSYFGANMLECGDVVHEIEPGAHLSSSGQQGSAPTAPATGASP